jgi:hypothetical protein
LGIASWQPVKKMMSKSKDFEGIHGPADNNQLHFWG